MNIFQRILVFLFYTIGILLVAVPVFMVAVVLVVAYPLAVIYKDILEALGFKKR